MGFTVNMQSLLIGYKRSNWKQITDNNGGWNAKHKESLPELSVKLITKITSCWEDCPTFLHPPLLMLELWMALNTLLSTCTCIAVISLFCLYLYLHICSNALISNTVLQKSYQLLLCYLTILSRRGMCFCRFLMGRIVFLSTIFFQMIAHFKTLKKWNIKNWAL